MQGRIDLGVAFELTDTVQVILLFFTSTKVVK